LIKLKFAELDVEFTELDVEFAESDIKFVESDISRSKFKIKDDLDRKSYFNVNLIILIEINTEIAVKVKRELYSSV